MSESISSNGKTDNLGFFQYVFNFDEDNKAALLNMIQYTILAIIPVLIILKITKHIIPEEDESKGSLEIVLESAGQIIIIMLAIWFTNNSGGGLRVTQPLAISMPQHQPSQSDYLDRNQILPSNLQLTSMPPQQSPDFNQMYQNQAGGGAPIQQGMQNMMMDQGPMAANEVFGGGFSSW